MNVTQMDFFGDDVSYRVSKRRKKPSGKQLKERGMKRAVDHAGKNWKHAVLNAIREWRANWSEEGRKYAFEDIRLHLSEIGISQPPHVNAWGGICRSAVNAGIIRATGEYRLAKLPAAHARVVRLYEVA